ncbi:hypothetical protein [Halorarius halobius]|uniref:DUF7845 domain-containing protein n=1 Tax=Halorarius halobius TaxID=2962671 RepID=UPI0020CDF128|nr:hypothetical protein [Halorarius halobius]
MTREQRVHAGDEKDVDLSDVRAEDRNAEQRAEYLLSGDYSTSADDRDEDQDDHKDVEPLNRDKDLDDAVLDEATGRREYLAGQTHEHNAHLLFADDQLDDGLTPFFAFVRQFEPATVDDDGTITTPALDDVDPFEAAGTTWDVDRLADYDDPDDAKGTAKYWPGGIATRDDDAGDTYYEYNLPVYDIDDEKRNRRINFQIRPSLPDARQPNGDRINAMPVDLPEGVRVEINASNVDTHDIVDVLQALIAEMGARPGFYSRENIHPWSNVFGLAIYVRVLRDLADDLLVGPDDGLLERLAQFSSRRDGRGEYKWNNERVTGQRSAVALNPTSLNRLYGDHAVGKLLKSYLLKHASKTPNDPDVAPTDHPKLEVQWNREHTPNDLTVRWFDDHADDGEIGRETLEAELRTYLLNCLSWAGLPTSPDDGVFVDDDHFDQAILTNQDDADRLQLVGCPIDQVVEHERSVATRELLANPPTEAESDVLRAASDGGRYDGLDDLADAADRSTSTVSRTLRKFERLFERVDGVSVADSIVRDRLNELFATLDSAVDRVERGLSHLATANQQVDDDSAFGKWARRYGVDLVDDRDGLELRLAAGNFSLYELHVVLRSGYQAAKDTIGIDELRFLDAGITYHDADGDRDSLDRIAVWHGSSLKLRGREDVFALD